MGNTVLVVDDNDMNRDVLSRRLQREGYEVSTVENGKRALDTLTLEKYDVILLDIMMPEMDGFETLKKIRGELNLKSVPVIMLTSLNEMEDVKKCINLGANDYVLKPYNIEDLKSRIQKHIVS
ncbi:MAG: response regulator [Gammaproteobacteria bacterium]|nr:response regulator [Gammaproteobacteria bacterium]